MSGAIVGIVGAIVRRQKKIVAAFREANATRPDRARSAATLGVDEGQAFRILRRHDILREAPGGGLYIDEARWEAHEARRRRIAILAPVVTVVAAAVIALLVSLLQR